MVSNPALTRVWALGEEAPEDKVPAAAQEWQNGWRWGWRYAIQAVRRAVCGADGCGYPNCWHPELGCPRFAALDSTDPVEDAPSYREAANRDGLVVQHTCGAVRIFDCPPVAGRCGECPEPGAWTQLYRRNDPDGTHPDVPAPGRPTDVYCFCADCIRCGCGMWESHHADLSAVVPAPGRSGEDEFWALRYPHLFPRSDSGLPVDGEERK